MKSLLLVLAFLFLWVRPLLAEPVVTAIEVSGNEGVESQAILATIRSRVGTSFSREMIRQDILALFRMGVFEDIRVEKVVTGEGVRLLYKVVEKSKITEIRFEGNKKIKEAKLRELITVKTYSSVDANLLAESVRKIRGHYESEGYHLAEVTVEYRSDAKTGGRELIFQIREHEPVRIQRVRFLGNKAFSDRELKKLLKSKEKTRWSWLTRGGKFNEEAIKRDVAFLIYHYQNHGYLKVRVTAPQVTLTRDRRALTLTFRIQEGAPYRVKGVDVVGDILTTREEMITLLKTKPGELYSRERLEEDLLKFSELYGDQGYAFAAINPAIQADDETLTCGVTVVIEKGKRITIEKINISGNTITRDKVIRREIPIQEGSLFNETKLRNGRRRLEALGFFEEVNFATPRGSTDEEVDLNIIVKEKPTGTFSIGAGFSSAENFIFNASVSKNNFFGYGISGQVATELSSKRQLFILSGEDPYFLDTHWILGVSGFRTVNVFTDFDRSSFGGSLTLGRRVFDHSTIRLAYQIEDVDVGDFKVAVPPRFSGNLSGITSSVTTSLERDTRNNRLFPSKGMYHVTSGEFAGVGGDTKFIRATENLRLYQPLYKSVVTKFNFTFSNVNSLTNLPVPLFERFFMGGINSLRGFTLRSIGPQEGGFSVGGTTMLQANFELELPLYDPAGFRAVTFVDAGQAYGEGERIALTRLRSNYGFGFRWNSPIGPLRFEWGLPFKRQTGEDSVVFNFAIGSFF